MTTTVLENFSCKIYEYTPLIQFLVGVIPTLSNYY